MEKPEEHAPGWEPGSKLHTIVNDVGRRVHTVMDYAAGKLHNGGALTADESMAVMLGGVAGIGAMAGMMAISVPEGGADPWRLLWDGLQDQFEAAFKAARDSVAAAVADLEAAGRTVQ